MHYRFVSRGVFEHVQIGVRIGLDDRPLWTLGIGGQPNDLGSCFLAAEAPTLEVAAKKLIRQMRQQAELVDQAAAAAGFPIDDPDDEGDD